MAAYDSKPTLRVALANLGDELAEANSDGASSNDLIQMVDDWFASNDLPTFLYR